MPKGRSENDWEIWQVADKTGFGKFLGLGTRDVDFNITKRIRSKFIEWLGKPKRWGNEPDEPDVLENCVEWQISADELLGHFKNAGIKFDLFEDALNQMVQEAENLRDVIKENIE